MSVLQEKHIVETSWILLDGPNFILMDTFFILLQCDLIEILEQAF